MPDLPLEMDYARLIHLGINNSPRSLERLGDLPVAELARWQAEEAEPWWQAIRERADADGLRVECYVEQDGYLNSTGFETRIAFARLLSPDGHRYKMSDWLPSKRELAKLRRDWGAILAAARERHPYDYAFERKLAAFPTRGARHAPYLASLGDAAPKKKRSAP
jgi:hypothetical protein